MQHDLISSWSLVVNLGAGNAARASSEFSTHWSSGALSAPESSRLIGPPLPCLSFAPLSVALSHSYLTLQSRMDMPGNVGSGAWRICGASFSSLLTTPHHVPKNERPDESASCVRSRPSRG